MPNGLKTYTAETGSTAVSPKLRGLLQQALAAHMAQVQSDAEEFHAQERKNKQSDKWWMEQGKAAPGLEDAISPVDFIAPAAALGAARLGAKAARLGAGRIATNVWRPVNYNVGEHVADLRNAGFKGIVKAIVEDKPIYSLAESADTWGVPLKNPDLLREVPYRKMFGLKPRAGSEYYVENANGTLSFNPEAPKFAGFDRDLNTLLMNPHDEVKVGLSGHSVMARYDRQVAEDGAVAYHDVWDFAANKGEWGETFRGQGRGFPSMILRSIMNKVSKPVTIEGIVQP